LALWVASGDSCEARGLRSLSGVTEFKSCHSVTSYLPPLGAIQVPTNLRHISQHCLKGDITACAVLLATHPFRAHATRVGRKQAARDRFLHSKPHVHERFTKAHVAVLAGSLPGSPAAHTAQQQHAEVFRLAVQPAALLGTSTMTGSEASQTQHMQHMLRVLQQYWGYNTFR
jgi:hypothetical protein